MFCLLLPESRGGPKAGPRLLSQPQGGETDFSAQLTAARAKTARCLFNAALACGRL